MERVRFTDFWNNSQGYMWDTDGLLCFVLCLPRWRRIRWGSGWGNGYVCVPSDHWAFGYDESNIVIPVHGGITFTRILLINNKLYNVFGFDTCHWQDEDKDKEFVIEETNNMCNFLKNDTNNIPNCDHSSGADQWYYS